VDYVKHGHTYVPGRFHLYRRIRQSNQNSKLSPDIVQIYESREF